MTSKKNRVLILESDKDLLKNLDERLSNEGYKVFHHTEEEEILKRVTEVCPDLILMDMNYPGVDGVAVKQELDLTKSTAGIPVVFLTVDDSGLDKVRSLKMGMDDYVVKPFNGDELIARLETIVGRKEYCEKLSLKDSLTGFFSLNYLEELLPQFSKIAKRYKKLFSIGVANIDGFDVIKNTYGYQAGDFILQKFSDVVKETFRSSDVIARSGKDEFAVLMPETDTESAVVPFKRLREKIESTSYHFEQTGHDIRFSFGSGIVGNNEGTGDGLNLLKHAHSKISTSR